MNITVGQLREVLSHVEDCEDDTDISLDWFSEAHSGPGLYWHFSDYPDEGCEILLHPQDPDFQALSGNI